MVDRKLVGILAIALILSTGAFSFIVGERVKEPIEILKHAWNIPRNAQGDYALPRTEGRYVHSLGLVIRKPVRRLEILFATLENSTFQLESNASIDPSPAEQFLTIEGVGSMTSRIQGYAESSGARLENVGFSLAYSGGEYDGRLIDFTDLVRPVAQEELQHSLPTVHALLFNSSGLASQYYRGYPDFYLNRETAILDLTIQHNQNVTRYSQRTTEQGTSLLMKYSPQIGRIVFDDLAKEDQVFVTTAIDSARPELSYIVNPPWEAVIHLALIFVDGEYYDGLATLIYR